jgi:hypothetical protein
MCRSACNFLLAIAILAVLKVGISFGQPDEKEPPFQWLASSGETSGVKFTTHQLRPISLETYSGPPVEIEQQESRPDSKTIRITRRVFSTSVNGERRMTETIVEEIKKMPEGSVRAVRTTSRRNANGSFSPVQKEIQEMTKAGTDVYRITKTLLLQGTNNSLIEKQQIRQIERLRGDKSVEIDRTRYEQGLNGGWSAAERRVSQNRLDGDRTRTEEQVYRYEVNNRPDLILQLRINEWKDAAGRRHLQSESFAPNSEGKLQLDGRITIVQTPLRNDQQETTEILEQPSPATPNEGLKMVRKIVENLEVHNANETERQLEVLEPDLNGGLRTIHSQQSIEVK